jgi:hypothetical protein
VIGRDNVPAGIVGVIAVVSIDVGCGVFAVAGFELCDQPFRRGYVAAEDLVFAVDRSIPGIRESGDQTTTGKSRDTAGNALKYIKSNAKRTGVTPLFWHTWSLRRRKPELPPACTKEK